MKKISHKLIHWMFCCFLGGVFPILFFIIGWWGSIDRVPENKIFLVACAGLIWGITLNFLVLKRILKHLYSLPLWMMSLLYLFYSICMYGFFMGFPVLNVFLGIPAGMYMGIKYKNSHLVRVKKIKMMTSIFTSLVMLIFCISTALLALSEKTIGSELQKMLGLRFAVTMPMIYGTIMIGGSLLILSQYFLTSFFFTKYFTSDEFSIQP